MPALSHDLVWNVVTGKFSGRTEVPQAPRFQPGDTVYVRNINPPHHTRSPRYIRGRTGTVISQRGAFPLPDSVVLGTGPNAQHVYSVLFTFRELWGGDADPRDTLVIELWEEYLDPAVRSRSSWWLRMLLARR